MIDRHFIDEDHFDIALRALKSTIPIQHRVFDQFIENYYFTEEQLETLAPYFEQENWGQVSTFQREVLTEQFVRNHKDQLRWLSVCFHWRFSIDFLREMKDYVDWRPICSNYTVIDDTFIKEFYDYLEWHFIIKFQVFNIKFAKKYRTELRKYAEELFENDRIPEDIKRKIIDYLISNEV